MKKFKHHYAKELNKNSASVVDFMFKRYQRNNTNRSAELYTRLHQGAKILYHDISDGFRLFVNAEFASRNEESEKALECRKIAFQSLQEHLEAGVAYFKLVVNPNKQVSYSLRGQEYTVNAPEINHFATCSDWYRIWSVAIMLRNGEAFRSLMTYTPAHTKDSPFEAAFCAFLQGIFDAKADIKTLLVEVVQCAESGEGISKTRQPEIDIVLLRVLMVWVAIIDKDEQAYQDKLLDASKYVGGFYGGRGQLKAQSVFCLPPLLIAASVIAYDQNGWQVKYDNPYIPNWIVTGDFPELTEV